MAEDEPSGSGWWTGWLQTAKEKSASALEFVKNDLAEFTTTVQHDTTRVAENLKEKITQENAATATEKVKAGVTTLLGGISKALIIEPEDRNDPGVPIHIFSRAQARLHAVQLDPATYCDEPSGQRKQYEAWLETFKLDDMKGDISELLVSNVEVRALYTQMVPSSVSHADFWQRYFYKVFQLDQDEARKEALKKRADEAKEQADLEWDDDDWCDIGGPSSPPTGNHMEAAAALSRQTQKEMEDKQDINESQTAQTATSSSATTNSEQYNPDVNETEEGRLKNVEVEQEGDVGTVMSNKMQSVQINEPSPGDEPQDGAAPVESGCSATDLRPASSSSDAESKDSLSSGMVVVSDTCSKDSLSSGVVIVNSSRTTPSPDSSTTKVSSSLDDEWEQEFDLDVTEEDIRMAQEAASKLTGEEGATENDWENWE